MSNNYQNFNEFFPLELDSYSQKRKIEYISSFEEEGAQKDDLNEESSYASKLKISLNNQEEIAEWIKERKANYPTAQNIKKKRLKALNEEIIKDETISKKGATDSDLDVPEVYSSKNVPKSNQLGINDKNPS
ncbi:hypothetical protein BB560_006983, partial [Smittium megazygosporum]